MNIRMINKKTLFCYSIFFTSLTVFYCVLVLGCSPDRQNNDSIDKKMHIKPEDFVESDKIMIRDHEMIRPETENFPQTQQPTVSYTVKTPPVEYLGDIRTVSVHWSQDYELLDGEVRYIFAEDNTLYVLGNKFDISAYPEGFQRYLSAPERSIYTHIADFFPSFIKVLTAFVSQYNFDGIELSQVTVDALGNDTMSLAFPIDKGVAFLVHSMQPGNESSLNATLGVVDDTGIHYAFEESRKRVNIRHADNLIIDYTPLLNSESETNSVLVYEAMDGPNGLSSRLLEHPYIFAPSWFNIVDAAYIRDGTIFGWNGDMVFEISIDDNTVEVFNLEYEDRTVFSRMIYRQAEFWSGRSYLIGELDLSSKKGFFWSFSNNDRYRDYSYVLQSQLSINSMLVVPSGVFFTGTQDEKMLLMLLNHDGEVQWRAHLGEGTLRGIAEYEGRYFVIGDRLEIRTEEYGDRGTSVMYLAEIDLSWL